MWWNSPIEVDEPSETYLWRNSFPCLIEDFLFELITVYTQTKWLLLVIRKQYLRRLEIDEEQYIQSKAAENPGHKGNIFLFIFLYDWLLCLCDDCIPNVNNQYHNLSIKKKSVILPFLASHVRMN